MNFVIFLNKNVCENERNFHFCWLNENFAKEKIRFHKYVGLFVKIANINRIVILIYIY